MADHYHAEFIAADDFEKVKTVQQLVKVNPLVNRNLASSVNLQIRVSARRTWRNGKHNNHGASESSNRLTYYKSVGVIFRHCSSTGQKKGFNQLSQQKRF
ncbi:hypothetical protein J6590_094161 [Homalodisca vitripennis]|nr:hypothetical protein J6590_094161 [Homalodisca vitripennis]